MNPYQNELFADGIYFSYVYVNRQPNFVSLFSPTKKVYFCITINLAIRFIKITETSGVLILWRYDYANARYSWILSNFFSTDISNKGSALNIQHFNDENVEELKSHIMVLARTIQHTNNAVNIAKLVIFN